MLKEWMILVFCLIATVHSQEDPNTKEVDEANERIVGGSEATGEDRIPFLAIFNFHPGHAVKCSANIISPFWLTSAAHCIVQKSHIFDGSCLKNFPKAKFETVCELQPNGDMKLTFPVQQEPGPEVYVGLDSLEELNAPDKKKIAQIMVDFLIVHKDGYKGGVYGGYGGYDTILVKTRTSMLESNSLRDFPIDSACLPGPDFQHTKPQIAGYGRYRRVPCETNNEGPVIYNYCKVEQTCDGQSNEFASAKCNVEFTYNGKVHKGCIKDQDTPSAHDPECIGLKNRTQLDDKTMLRDNINELVITDKAASQVITKCYRNTQNAHGWCGTTNKIITSDADSLIDHETVVSSQANWGVCSKTCDVKNREATLSGVPRLTDVQIISQEYCEEKLNMLRAGRTPFHIHPKVLCVALNETYSTQFYAKQDDGSYILLDKTAELETSLLGRPHPWYIRATGSCKGDSGGPLFQKIDDPTRPNRTFVLLGSTSRGTGKLQNCGGIENPTHYVRIKDFVPWITSYVGADQVCIQS